MGIESLMAVEEQTQPVETSTRHRGPALGNQEHWNHHQHHNQGAYRRY
jgi:hypothetical protein